MRVLHVEDDPADQMIVRRSVRDAERVEFVIETVESIGQARERLRDGEFDLIALDLSLPDSFGVGTLDVVRETAPDLPVVVMTGNDDVDLGLELIHRGAEDYLVKAKLTSDAVIACFRYAYERHRSRVALDRARREAEEASRAKSRFVSSMSHEIRTPLNAIIGMADLLAEADLEPDHRQYVEIFRRSGRNLLFLLNNVLELSCVEAGTVKLARGPFSPNEVARAALDTFAYAAHKKRITLALESEVESEVRLLGDVDRIRQILINLLGNAVKFTDTGHVLVRVGLSERPGSVTLRADVEDTGPGVPEDARDAIFDSYVRADHGTDVKSGTGLGLKLCVDLLGLMQGTLELESEVGVGSRFRVEIPLERAESEPCEISRIDGQALLVAANDTVERAVLAADLVRHGAAVSVASSVDEARECVRDRGAPGFDVLIVDCRFEGGGMGLAEECAREGSVPRIVVLLPLDHRREDIQRCRSIDAIALLRPVAVDELCARLCHARDAEESPIEPATAETEFAPESMRILLAEDSAENRTVVEAYLAKLPIEVVVARDGAEAVEAACPGVYDLILMDMNMPEKDGLTATREIRAYEEANQLGRTPILALTAYAFAEQAKLCRDAGCDAHLAKPIAKRDLLDEIVSRGRRSFGIDPDHDLADLADEFLLQRWADVRTIRGSIDSGAFDASEVCGHNMKGAGLGYGFPLVSAIGAAVERAAKQRDAERLGDACAHLEAFLARSVRTDEPRKSTD